MDEAAALCDRVLIVDNGKIIETGVPQQLIKEHVGEDVLEVAFDETILKKLKEELPEAHIEIFGDQIRVFINQPHGVFERSARGELHAFSHRTYSLLARVRLWIRHFCHEH